MYNKNNNNTDYNKSNSIDRFDKNIKNTTKKYFNKLSNDSVLTTNDLQKLANIICFDFGVSNVNIVYSGVQPHATNGKGGLKNKVLGIYKRTSIYQKYEINLFKYTAKQKKVVANKTTLKTLIHELNHHFDYELLGLKKSIHTKGFYMRISNMLYLLRE